MAPNDPSSATTATSRADCNHDGPPPFAAAQANRKQTLFGDFRGILSRAEIEFAEEEKDSGSEVVEGTEAARIGLDGLDA